MGPRPVSGLARRWALKGEVLMWPFGPHVAKLHRRGDVEGLIRVVERGLRAKRLGERDQATCLAAASALGEIGDARAAPALVECLRWRWGREVAPALVRIGAPAVPPLVALLDEKGAYSEGACLEALAAIGDPRAIGHLILALDDIHHEVDGAAREALRSMGCRAVEPLAAALLEGRVSAYPIASLLADIGGPEAVTGLTAAVSRGRSEGVQRAAAEALGRLGGKRAAECLAKALARRHKSWGTPTWVTVTEALIKTASAAVGPLIQALGSAPETSAREHAATALGRIGDRRAVESLIAALDGGSAEAEVCAACAEALGAIGDARATEALVGLLGSESQWVCKEAAMALERLGASGDPAVRAWSALARKDWRTVETMGADAVEALCRAIAKELRDEDRVKMIAALGRTRDARGVDVLLGVIEHRVTGDSGRVAAIALAEVADATCVPPLLALRRTEYGHVRNNATLALVALYHLGRPGTEGRQSIRAGLGADYADALGTDAS